MSDFFATRLPDYSIECPAPHQTLLISADPARRSGAEDQARAYHARAERLLTAQLEAGITATNDRAFELAMLRAFEGRNDDAAKHLAVAIQSWNFWMDAYGTPLLSEVVKHPEFQSAMQKRRAVLARQRAEVLQMLCGPEPVDKSYTRLPATCARMHDGQGGSK